MYVFHYLIIFPLRQNILRNCLAFYLSPVYLFTFLSASYIPLWSEKKSQCMMFKLYQHEFASQETESTHIYLSRLSNKTLKQFLVITARRNQITHSIRQYFLNYVSFNIKSGKGKKNDFRQISTDLLLLRIFSNRQKISFLLQIVLEIVYFQKLYKIICQDYLIITQNLEFF